MHVVHVIPGIDPLSGGPAVALAGLACAQARAGIRVSVLHTWMKRFGKPDVPKLREAGIEVTAIGPVHTPLQFRAGMKRAVEAAVAGASIVHIHGLWESVLHHAARAAQKRNVTYFVRPCGMLDPWSLAQNPLRKRLMMAWRVRENLKKAMAVHCTSRTEEQQVQALGFRTTTLVVPNGVDLAEFSQLPPLGTFRARYPQIGGRPLVVFLGRIHPGKGLEYLVPALAKATRTQPFLAIVGPDSEGFQAKVEEMIRTLGLSDRVVFTGLLRGADRVAALADADIFALPSDHENFGVAVIEALAAGRPVIVSDQVNIHREISDARVGGVVPTNVDAVAAELDRWLGDRALLEEAAARARPFVFERYDWDKIARSWATTYTSMNYL